MRQFIAPSMPDDRGHLILCGRDFRYLYQVLRLRPGEAIHVRLPSGALETMAVIAVCGRSITLVVCPGGKPQETGVTAVELEESVSSGGGPLWLFQFMPKAQKMDLIVRQATELGVLQIVPILGACCQKETSCQRSERWQRIIREARQQSGSPVQTQISDPCSLTEALDLWKGSCGASPLGVILYEKSQGAGTFHQVVGISEHSAVGLVVGSEGGITSSELQILVQAGFAPVHLGTSILRVETAALYGLAVLQNLLTERHVWQSDESNC